MKIEFTTDKITEFATGNFYVKNTGSAFDIPHGTAPDFLSKQHLIDGEWVPVFKVAEIDGNVEVVVEGEIETVESLAKKTRPELEELAKDAGLDGDSYMNKTELATAILAVKGDK